MTATSRVSHPIRLALVLASLAAMSGSNVVAQDAKQQSAQHKRQSRCLSDEGTIRACLVPERELEGRPNIPLGQTGCFWAKESEKEKHKQYKRSANGRPRQFTFQVVNLCSEKVNVAFELALEGTLRFQTERCEKDLGAGAKGGYLTIPLGTIEPGREASVSCDTRPYKGKFWFFGTSLRRQFKLGVTGYGGTSFDTPIYFDPEVVLEKSGGES